MATINLQTELKTNYNNGYECSLTIEYGRCKKKPKTFLTEVLWK